MTASIIVAIDDDNGIGKDGGIPWFFSEDMKFFARTTKGGTCIMGRKTYESMVGRVGNEEALLKGRQCIVVTRNTKLVPVGAEVAYSLLEAIQRASRDDIFFMGGASIYSDALAFVDRVYITRVPGDFECDVNVNSMMDGILQYYRKETSTTSEAGLTYDCYIKRTLRTETSMKFTDTLILHHKLIERLGEDLVYSVAYDQGKFYLSISTHRSETQKYTHGRNMQTALLEDEGTVDELFEKIVELYGNILVPITEEDKVK